MHRGSCNKVVVPKVSMSKAYQNLKVWYSTAWLELWHLLDIIYFQIFYLWLSRLQLHQRFPKTDNLQNRRNQPIQYLKSYVEIKLVLSNIGRFALPIIPSATEDYDWAAFEKGEEN